MRRLLNRISLRLKFIISLLLILGSSVTAIVALLSLLERYLQETHDIVLVFKELLLEDILRIVVFMVLGIFIVAVFIYRDLGYYLRSLNKSIEQTLEKKRFISGFETYKTKGPFAKVAENANKLMVLFKRHDQLKSERVAKELGTLKAMMNVVSEAVIFVNSDKIVTHINHHAETYFGLISGEIIGQIISRNISNEAILSHLDKVLKQDVKVTDLPVTLKSGAEMTLNLLPIKNRDLKITRVVIVLAPLEASKGEDY